MSGPSLTTDAIVLFKRPPMEAFESLTALSPSHGILHILRRIPRKASAQITAFDLFDELSLLLEGASQGDAWFTKESRLLVRHTAIGHNYQALVRASSLATIIARNPLPEESRGPVHALLKAALSAFSVATQPDVVYLKSLYRLARDEGHPVRQHWFGSLPATLRDQAYLLLHKPLTESPNLNSEPLIRSLETFLRDHADLEIG